MQRIVSLVPSLTEFLVDLGLENEVVGLTKFCVHPAHLRAQKVQVGGTKNVNHARIASLQPSLIIANKEENTKEDIERLMANYPVLLTEIYTLDDAFAAMLQIGKAVGKCDEAEQLVVSLKRQQAQFQPLNPPRTYLYFIWKDPYFVAGKQTYIDALLSEFGLQNVCQESRYPKLESKQQPAPELVFLSSEPYPFQEKDIELLQQRFPSAKILLIDGEMCSWYGSRMKKAFPYLATLLSKI
jgi:ABC-type Fe3+-hydroxamate transport system substrate-binding protein